VADKSGTEPPGSVAWLGQVDVRALGAKGKDDEIVEDGEPAKWLALHGAVERRSHCSRALFKAVDLALKNEA